MDSMNKNKIYGNKSNNKEETSMGMGIGPNPQSPIPNPQSPSGIIIVNKEIIIHYCIILEKGYINLLL